MNCLLYARVSTDRQAQKALSIPAQIDTMKQYALANKWTIVDRYIDEGESAKSTNRPELKKLIEYCRSNKNIDVVLIHKIDRLERNLIDYATIKAILKQKGIKLVSISEPFEDNPVGNLLENIIASISEWYSANLGEEIKKSNLSKLKKGEYPNKPPIGYKSIKGENNRTKHVSNEKTAPLVKQSFELFSTGYYSLRLLSEEMENRGLVTKYGNKLSAENMKRLLKNRFYIGKILWRGKEYEGIHSAIIDKKLFYSVQEILKLKSRDSGEKGKLQFLLRGLLYCKVCNQRLTGEIHKRGSYYRCLPGSNYSKCTERYSPVKSLDDQIETIYSKLNVPSKITNLIEYELITLVKKRQNQANYERNGLERKINEIKLKEMKLVDEMLGNKIGHSVYGQLLCKYQKERREAESRLSQYSVNYEEPIEFLNKCLRIAKMLSHLHHKLKFEDQKLLLKAVFEKIFVKDRKIVDVKRNLPFSIFFEDDLKKMFKNSTVVRTRNNYCSSPIMRAQRDAYSTPLYYSKENTTLLAPINNS